MSEALNHAALEQLFLSARTHNGWQDKPVSDELLERLYTLAIQGPTSANSLPARFVFVKSAEAKAKLKEALAPGNVDKTMEAPVTVIIGADHEFYEQLPKYFPHTDARSWFLGNQALIDSTAFRNSTLQGAYLIMAARALGLDTGAMSGFDAAKVNELFFAGTPIKANFLINIGYGDHSKLFAKSPRPAFADVAQIV